MKSSAKIQELNDKLRHNILSPIGLGQVVCTPVVSNLSFKDKLGLLCAIGRYNDFNPNNDPYGEHDYGSLNYMGEQYCFKIDYYDKDLIYHSDDPSDPTITNRVLTIMHMSEY